MICDYHADSPGWDACSEGMECSPVEPCPACEDGLIHPDDDELLDWTCDHCGYQQHDEPEKEA